MARPIFAEVSSDTLTPPSKAGEADRRQERNRRILIAWLICVAVLVITMILVGGLTRLTDSGLSITEWKPIMGALPPLSQQDWLIAFEKYKGIPEYSIINSSMTMEQFKVIFWWEWGHRQLGRLIGLVYVIPFVVFLIAGIVPRHWRMKLANLAILGGLQGMIGWWMVSSGLSERVDVAPIRLAVHLGLAFVILGFIVWFIFMLRLEDWQLLQARRRRHTTRATWAGVLVTLTFIQIFSGALVAGLDAGQWYIDWPLMGGEILPSESFDLRPIVLNLIENPALVQFNHRMLAYSLLVFAIIFYIGVRYYAQTRQERQWAGISLLILLAQAMIGISTVLNAAPLEWAIAHQAGGIIVWLVILHTKFVIQYPRAVQFK